MPPPKKRPLATTTSNIRPLAARSSTVTRSSVADQRAKTRERGPQVRRLPAECLGRLVRPLRDRAAHAGAARRSQTTPAASLPSQARYVTRPEVDLRARSPARATCARLLDRHAGCRTCARSPIPCRAARSPPRVRPSSPPRPLATSLTEPSPPTTTSSAAPPSAASRASAPRWPGRSLSSVSPDQAHGGRPARQLGPPPAGRAVRRRRVDEEDRPRHGASALFRPCVSDTRLTTPSRRAARARSSRRPPCAGPRREMRTNSPSTITSLTTSMQPVWSLRSAPSVNSTAASISTARMPRSDQRPASAGVRLVEDVAGHDRADAERLAEVLGLVHRLVHEAEVGRRRMRLVAHVVQRGRVGAVAESRDHEIADRQVRLQPAARADAHDLLHAELRRAPRSRSPPTGSPFRSPAPRPAALERAGVAEHAALAVPLHDVLEERLGDVAWPAAGRPGAGRLRRSHPGWPCTWIGMRGNAYGLPAE